VATTRPNGSPPTPDVSQCLTSFRTIYGCLVAPPWPRCDPEHLRGSLGHRLPKREPSANSCPTLTGSDRLRATHCRFRTHTGVGTQSNSGGHTSSVMKDDTRRNEPDG
jgi:hypothetical protein